MSLLEKNIRIVYNFPTDFNPLAKELRKRGISVDVVEAQNLSLDPEHYEGNFNLLYNDLSTPPGYNSEVDSAFHTSQYSRHFEDTLFRYAQGRIINPSQAIDVLASRARQLSLLSSLGVSIPKSRVVYSPEKINSVLSDLVFPVLLKRNNPFDATPVLRFNSLKELQSSLTSGELSTSKAPFVIQEYRTPKNASLFNIHVLNGRFLSATRIATAPNNSAYQELHVGREEFVPSPEIISTVEDIARKSRVDIGTIEYFVDQASNNPLFYAISPLQWSHSSIASTSFAKAIGDFFEKRLAKIREIELAL